MGQWYTLYTKPRAEYQVAAALQQKNVQTYLPEIKPPQAKRRREKEPLFPCYLFVKINIESVSYASVQWTPGLRRVVTCGDQPVSVPPEIIELIQVKVGELEASGGPPAHPFKPGDTVQITEGPFRDMLAIFEGPTTPSERVRVLLDILGRLSPVQVEPTALKKAPAEAEMPPPKRLRRTRGRDRRIRCIRYTETVPIASP